MRLRDVTFAARVLHANHWSIDPADAILIR